MKISIITPTVQRDSIQDLEHSLLSQTFKDWEWIIQVDCETVKTDLLSYYSSSCQVNIGCCGVKHNNAGNTCRHIAWERATGDWVLGIDDDNTLCSERSLEILANSLNKVDTPWVLVPMFRFGDIFLNDPPGLCQTDTANMVIRREIARWPTIPDYTADGILADTLRKSYPYTVLRDIEPVVFMDTMNRGER